MTYKFRINDVAHGARIARAAGVLFNPNADQVISRLKGDELLGGVIYNSFNCGGSINIHMAGFAPFWANKDMLWMAFDYPFNQLCVKKVIALVPATNNRALEIDKKMGFKEEARIADVYNDGDLIVLGMYREHCRWLR